MGCTSYSSSPSTFGVHCVMADYGLKIFDASGNTILDTSDNITRLRYSNEVASGVSGSTTLADISGLNSVEISVGLETGWNKASHLVTRSGTTISWTAKSGTYYTSANSLVFVFLYS